jgi:hypothetical protein
MTRYKEKARIDRALESGVPRELRWAAGYCQMRLSILATPQHEKHWRELLAKVKAKLEAVAGSAEE